MKKDTMIRWMEQMEEKETQKLRKSLKNKQNEGIVTVVSEI